jgi:hypothetical protein
MNSDEYFPTIQPKTSGPFYEPHRLRNYGKSQQITMEVLKAK